MRRVRFVLAVTLAVADAVAAPVALLAAVAATTVPDDPAGRAK